MVAPSLGGGISPVLPPALGDFESRRVWGDVYLLTLRDTKFITGATGTVYLDLPLPHRLLRLDLLHRDNADGNSSDKWSFLLGKRILLTDTSVSLRLMDTGLIEDYDFIWVSDDISEPTTYTFFNYFLTATDRIYPRVYIEVLGGV